MKESHIEKYTQELRKYMDTISRQKKKIDQLEQNINELTITKIKQMEE